MRKLPSPQVHHLTTELVQAVQWGSDLPKATTEYSVINCHKDFAVGGNWTPDLRRTERALYQWAIPPHIVYKLSPKYHLTYFRLYWHWPLEQGHALNKFEAQWFIYHLWQTAMFNSKYFQRRFFIKNTILTLKIKCLTLSTLTFDILTI